MFHINAKKFKELCLDSLNIKFDVIAVSENWLDKESVNKAY